MGTPISTWISRIIILATIGGGSVGLLETLKIALAATALSAFAWTAFVIAVIMYGYGIFVGLRESEGKGANSHVFIYFALQVPYVSSPWVAYHFTSGLHAIVAVIGIEVGWSFRIGSEWQFAILQPYPFGFGVNLVALAILFVVYIQRFYQRDSGKSHATARRTEEVSPYDY